jgi:bacterioferritin
MADEQLLAQLNKTLQSEYRTIFQYVQNSYMVKGMRRPAMVGWLRGMVQKEMQDAFKLADKIVSLGGIPTTEVPEITHSTKSEVILSESLALEEAAVEEYQECIRLAAAGDNTALRVFLEGALASAEEDAEEVRKMLEE